MDPVYEQVFKNQSFTSYRPVQQTSPNLASHVTSPAPAPRRLRRSRVVFHWLSHILSLLWVAPIAILLWLNLSKHVIGASVWCPRHNCNADGNSDNAIERATKLDRQDHNVAGALQFVAKALEVWFFFVATSLVYDMGIMFAQRGRGLPVGYFLTHLEFGDVRNLLNPLLWTSPLPHRTGVPEKRARIIKLYIFACATALLTILANLMGPAAAVLVLPTLQWVDTPRIMHQTFNVTGATHQPSGGGLFPGCSAAQLDLGNYSCTADTYGPSLDQWTAQSIASTKQAFTPHGEGSVILGVSQEAALQFTINVTANADVTWVPSRQVLREMSHDFLKARGHFADWDTPEYPDREFNNSLQTILQRQGPSLGYQGNCYTGNVTDVDFDDGRWIRCYTGWLSNDGTEYTKCFRLGLGPANKDNQSEFFLENLDPNVTQLETGIGIYFADRATLFSDSDDFGSGIKECLARENSEDCDWDGIFAAPLPDRLTNTTVNVGIVSYEVPGPDRENGRKWCEHVVYQSFPTYSVDTSPRTNLQNLVMLNNLAKVEMEAIPMAMNPSWFLAAWSVDVNSTLDGERQIVKELSRMLPLAYEDDLSISAIEFMFLHFYALGQSLSMVNHHTYDVPADPKTRQAKEADKDKYHPIFRTYATIHVWAYGISGRTAKLGIAVVSLGAVCVIARFLIGLRIGIQERSTVEMLAAAFEHRHQREFDGLEEDNELAKVRYQVFVDVEGKQRFMPGKRTTRWSNANTP
ncbi:MAG: hypothetical protein Q9171_007319 [Xanthocarpia ochracea]